MEINSLINFNTYYNNSNFSKNRMEKNTTPVINLLKYPKINSLNYIAYNNISFKGQNHTNISKLIDLGYESAKIGADGRLVNKGKNIILSNADELIALSKTEKAWSNNYILCNDIDLKNKNFAGIGSLKKYYSGSFDGNGYTIKNLLIDKDIFNSVGFFRTCNNASIKNLTIKNAVISGKSDVGCLVGACENNTLIENVKISGNIKAQNVAGGVVGYSKNSIINNSEFNGRISPLSENISQENNDSFFYTRKVIEDNISKFFGGIAGVTEDTQIIGANVNADITNTTICGGITGQSDWSKIHDSVFNGNIDSRENYGYLVGSLRRSQINRAYSLTEKPLIGENRNSSLSQCFSCVDALNEDFYHNWNSEIWNIAPQKLPRLKLQLSEMDSTLVFLEDLNNDIKNNNIKINTAYVAPKSIKIKLDNMEYPKHYQENDSILNKIKNSTNSAELERIFVKLTDANSFSCDPENKKHDEVLLALVKNPYFNLNKKWNNNVAMANIRALTGSFEAATFCTPLYVLSALNKGYVFQEALKRDDINPFIKNGSSSFVGIFDALYYAPIATNMFLLFNSKNPKVQEYVKQMKSQLPLNESSDKLTNLLCHNSFAKFKYDEITNEVEIPISVLDEFNDISDVHFDSQTNYKSLWDVINSPDLPMSYQDSLGNNILHLLAQKNMSPQEEVTYFEIVADEIDLNQKNKNGDTPYILALKNKKDLLCLKMLEKGVKDKYYTDAEGNNLLLINQKYNKTKQALLLTEKLHNMGFSLNTTDKMQSTPLIEAVKNNDMQKLNYLLLNGAAVDLCDENGQTAMHHAFINHNIQAIKWLMDNYACLSVKDKIGLTPKDYWPECDSIEEFAALNWDAAVITYNYAGIQAVDSQSLNVTNLNNLSKESIDLNYFNVEELKTKGKAQEKALVHLYLYLCSKNSDKQESQKFLSQLAITNNPYTKECLIKILNDKLVDINEKNEDGDTPLLSALKSYQMAETDKEKLSCMQNIKCLLDFGANVDIADDNGQTALHHAVFTNNIMIFNEILGKHPNINHTDILGKNPIQYIEQSQDNPMRKVYNIYAEKRSLN